MGGDLLLNLSKTLSVLRPYVLLIPKLSNKLFLLNGLKIKNEFILNKSNRTELLFIIFIAKIIIIILNVN